MGWLTPQTTTAPEPHATRLDANVDEAKRYLRSYQMMRTAIGGIGLALPIVLLLGDALFLDGGVLPRGSLSAYYHSGMRDVFVGALCATAIFLITYKVVESSLDNTLSTIGGVAALGVAVFPTGRPGDAPIGPTPLQEALGEPLVAAIHFGSAALFILSLAAISYYFGVREGSRPEPRVRWRAVHWACAAVIVLTVLGILLSQATGVLDEFSLLVGEVVAVFAFGISWLLKGLRLADLAHGRVRVRARSGADPVSA
jgi:hypothetical protein